MKGRRRPRGQQRLRAPVLGFVDGIMNALTLAAGSILRSGEGMGVDLAVRIGGFAFVTGWFVLLVSGYVGLRSELVHAERQLNLTEHGRLATTRLGHVVLREALIDAGAGGAASFIGSVIPLLAAQAIPGYSWISIAIAISMLAALGALLARTIHGRPTVWAVALTVGGVVLTAIGFQLHIT